MPTPTSPDTPPDLDQLEAALRACRAEIGSRIQSARTSTEQEVVAIGECVQNIVERAKGFIREVDAHRSSQAQTDTQTSAMVKEMLAAVHEQETTVSEAMTQSSAILRAGQDVQMMAHATRLLSLNARVEASRLGEQGSSFSVIADEMRQLAHSVQQTNSSVGQMAKGLETLLPQISQQTRAIQQQFEAFNRHVETQMKAVRSAQEEIDSAALIDSIVKLAYEALSHLAFQDPMVQSLERINESLDRLGGEMNRMRGVEPTTDGAEIAPAAPAAGAPDPDVEAGEVLLF